MKPDKTANEPEHYEVNLDQIRTAPELSGHQWVGKGTTEIVCLSCPFTHGYRLEPGWIYTGLDGDGYPTFKRRDVAPSA